MQKQRRPFIVLSVAIVMTLLFTGAGCRKAPQTTDVVPDEHPAEDATTGNFGLRYSFDEATPMAVGDGVVYADGLTMRLSTIEDSRCPAEVACIWEGELAPVLDVAGGQVTDPQQLRLGTVRGLWDAIGPYSVSASDVTEERMTVMVHKAAEGETPEVAVTRLISDKYGKDPASVTVVAEQDDGLFARGTVRFAPESSAGGEFLAAMVDGYWILVYDGDGSVDCFVLRADFGFPEEMLHGFCDPI